MKNPLVSILIPVFNMDLYLHDCIQSAVQQNYKNIEIIISDNSSTDNSFNIAKSFNDCRITLIKNESNIGAVGNFNKLISLSRGEYIKFLEADDTLDPTCVEELLNPLLLDSQVIMSCCGKRIIDSNGRVTGTEVRKLSETLQGFEVLNRIRIMGNEFGTPTDILFSKSAIALSGVFDEAYGSYLNDWDLWIRLAKIGHIHFIAKPLVCVRRHSAQIGSIGAKSNLDIYVNLYMVKKNFKNSSGKNLLLVHFSSEFIRRAFGKFITSPTIPTLKYLLDTLSIIFKEIGPILTFSTLIYAPTLLTYYRYSHRLKYRVMT